MKQKGGVRKLCFIDYLSFAPFMDYTCATQKYWEHKNKSPFLFVLFLTSFFVTSLLFLTDHLVSLLWSVKPLEGASLTLPVIAVGGGTLVPMIPIKPVMKPLLPFILD